MSKPEIQDKLRTFLNECVVFSRECEVVYLLVEIRKVLDHDKDTKHRVLRFYCDWSVHTAKDKITAEMREIMEEIYTDVFNEITGARRIHDKKTKIVGFMYMEDLQKDLFSFLEEYELPTEICNEDNWLLITSLLVSILADQPINKPCKNINQFSFLPARPGCVHGIIYFSSKIGNRDSYLFGNVN